MAKTAVFVSSTHDDLKKHRRAVEDILRKAGCDPIGMEDFGARDGDAVKVCQEEVEKADLFVGIYAWRYGDIPSGASRSFTEMELDEAKLRRKPCLYFLQSGDGSEELRDTGDKANRLLALRERIRQERVVDWFDTPDNLASLVAAAVGKWKEGRSTGRWSKLAALVVAAVGKWKERRSKDRERLRKSVEIWVEPVLPPTRIAGDWIPLPREQRSQAVKQSWEGMVEAAPTALPDVPIKNLFEGMKGKALLILGKPGSGKTTTLLQLTSELVDAGRDSKQPVPVFLKLSAWRGVAPRLDGWMAREIREHYKPVKRPVAALLIRKNHVRPLLDGLDEVAPGARDSCVAAINRFCIDHPDVGIVVTCRTQDNEELGHKLESPFVAVALNPPSPEMIAAYLTSRGEAAAALEATLREDEGWQELAQSPLMLGIMYKTLGAGGPGALGSSRGLSLAERTRILFKNFVEEMLKLPRKTKGRQPSKAQTVVRLTWLARQMKCQSCDPFMFEYLQPRWFSSTAQVWSYAIASRALVGGLLMLPLAVFFAPGLLIPYGLACGALAGLADGLRLRPGPERPESHFEHADGLRLQPGPERDASRFEQALARGGRRAFLFGAAAFLLFLLAGYLSIAAAHQQIDWSSDLPNGLRYGVLNGLLFGLVLGLRGGNHEDRDDTRVGEWEWHGRSGRGALAGAGLGVALCLVFWATGMSGVSFWLFSCLVFGVFGSVLGAFLGGFGPPGETEENETEESRKRRQLGRTLRNLGPIAVRGVLGLVLLLEIGYAVYLFSGGADTLALPGLTRKELWFPLAFSAALAFWLLLWAGGIDLVQHFTLRLLLSAARPMPFRWRRFLDFAADRILLKRSGASYEFYHRELREYFRKLPDSPPPKRSGVF